MRLALYQPDIPQNVGAMLRLGACLGVAVDIIGPCAFDVSDKSLRRAGMDYLVRPDFDCHVSMTEFARFAAIQNLRIVPVSSRGKTPYTQFVFGCSDVLLMGRESLGLPSSLLDTANVSVTIQMRPGVRSLNVATAAAMVLGEALRQTGGFSPNPARNGDINGD
jgi:tRNA (cytidine/uridine-2'-O-)-methyltransferase